MDGSLVDVPGLSGIRLGQSLSREEPEQVERRGKSGKTTIGLESAAASSACRVVLCWCPDWLNSGSVECRGEWLLPTFSSRSLPLPHPSHSLALGLTRASRSRATLPEGLA